MTGRIAIFGYGPVGSAIAARLFAEGREVIVAQRQRAGSPAEGSDLCALRRARPQRRRQGRERRRADRGRDRLCLFGRRLA